MKRDCDPTREAEKKPNMRRPLRNVILRAAGLLSKQSRSGFSVSQLIVAAWEMDRRAVGLAGFAESYPDANRVKCVLMGKKGLIAQGLLVKVGSGPDVRYRVSGRGAMTPMSEWW